MIWAAAAGARVISARALDEAELPSALATGALVVEDAGPGADERALFHLINLAREETAFSSLYGAHAAPATWPVAIPDLASRLRALPVITLQPPDDTMLRAVIIKLAADRQLLLRRKCRQLSVDPGIERSFAAARAAIIALDNEALRQRRRPTRALAAEMFGAASLRPERPSVSVMISPSATTSRLRGEVRRQANPIVRAGSGSVERESLTRLLRASTPAATSGNNVTP